VTWSARGIRCPTTDDDAAPKFKLGAIQGLRRWKQEAATRITEKKKKKLTLKGYSRVLLSFSLFTCIVNSNSKWSE